MRAELQDQGEQHPHAERAEDRRRGAVRHEQRHVGGERAQEAQRDALPGGPHAVQPEPARRGDRLEDDERDEEGVRAEHRRAGQQQPEQRGETGRLHARVDDRRTPLGPGPLRVGDPRVPGDGRGAVARLVGGGGRGGRSGSGSRGGGGLVRLRLGLGL